MDGMARYAPGQRSFVVRLTTRGRITIPKPARDALGVAILSKRGVPDREDLEDLLRDLADVRARLRGRGLDAVAVVRAGRRELERRSSAALGR